jgi:signal transduction histidine kinase/ligand-binding sensor domain-containing protein
MLRRARCLYPALVAAAAALGAERLPWSVYDASHGLAGDAVRNLFQDSRGLLWIGTSAGLSRFDGREFRSYDTRDGLPSPRIEAVAETPDGSIWVATSQGMARLRPAASAIRAPLFTVETLPEPLGSGAVDHLVAAPGGALYATRAELVMRLELDAAGRLAGRAVELPPELGGVSDVLEGADGTLWVGGWNALARLAPGHPPQLLAVGRTAESAAVEGIEAVRALAVDGAGRLWLAAAGALVAWLPEPAGAEPRAPLLARARRPRAPGDLPTRPGEAVVFGQPEGLPSPFVNDLAVASDAVWAAGRLGLFVVPTAGGGAARAIGVAHGLHEPAQLAALVDRDDALWLGSESRGLARLGRTGFVAFGEADGLAGDRASAIFEAPPGELHVVTWSRDLHRFAGGRFERLTPRALNLDRISGWGWNQFVLRDRRGRLWYPTGRGLYRFTAADAAGALVTARPERHWTLGSGLPGEDVFRLYEDRRGDVWVSTISIPCLTRFAGGEAPQPVPETEPCDRRQGAPTAFAEDGDGNLWIGFYLGQLARVTNGVWQFFGEADGVPPSFVSDLHLDRRGRLWIATAAGGVARVDAPGAPRPQFHRYTSRSGLTTDAARCLAEDAGGRIFVGTTRGVDRLDPETGGVRSFSTEDGLPNSLVYACHATPDGALWFGTLHGVARYLPPPERAPRPPRVWLAGLAVAGEPRAVPERGAETLPAVVLAPGQRSLRVDFFGIALDRGRDLLFESRLLGAGEDWSAPSPERSVQLAGLGPGAYRFEVRATTRDGVAGDNVAGFDFELLRPVWRRPWFVALGTIALAAAAAAAARLRTARLVAVERARARIASDLHDDVGSSVSRIGLLGELARRRLRDAPDAAEAILGEIGQEASELAEATSDIVWSIDPRRDDLGSLVVRLRRFAADLLEAKAIALEFVAPADAAAVALSPEVRRALYLTLKEAIHNVAKHSRARQARVAIALAGGELRAEVADDGCGIDTERARQAFAEGRHGLGGMAARAAAAGGEARVEPVAGGGTRVALRFPAGRSHRDAISRPPAG